MGNDTKFIDGLIFKAPREGAPDYIIAKVSIKRLELIEWLQSQSGEWINADLKESREGKFYAAVDTWKPGDKRQESKPTQQQTPRREPAPAARDFGDDFADDDIPF